MFCSLPTNHVQCLSNKPGNATTLYRGAHSTLFVAWHCALHRKYSGVTSRVPSVHMVAARLYWKRAMIRTWCMWATSHPHCMDRLRKHYSHLVGGWFLAKKAAWFWVGVRLPKVLTIGCLLMKGHGQSHKSAYYG